MGDLQQYHVVVIGGGAAGIFSAINVARLRPNWKVLVIEKTGKLLSKVKVSGGGRCNVTHACFDKKQLSSYYPRGASLVKKMVHHFFTTDTIQWFKERGVELKIEEDGRMFPVSNSSQSIIDVLLGEASRNQVNFKLYTAVSTIESTNNNFFTIHTNKGELIQANHCCVAIGGMLNEKTLAWLKPYGHTLISPAPSLFTFNAPGHSIVKLMGISVPGVRVRIQGTKLEETGPVLITHWGLSGPAILRLSAWGARWLQENKYQFTLHLNWLEDQGWNSTNLAAFFDTQRDLQPTKQLSTGGLFQLPKRLWAYFLSEADIHETCRFANLTAKQKNKLIKLLTDQEIVVSGKTTFKEEFVTAGGLDCNQIDPVRMESKLVPGLFFAGEVMDVDGVTGGFNFQHAWCSGYLAAKAMAG
ncbi:MAG: NAD(P)/FAD-dependent oxidoreductase [Bacteroidetes bacterium]|nr:NAD(P)/FAD-dependent oxidoreductase [Bacteroidota bacterium]